MKRSKITIGEHYIEVAKLKVEIGRLEDGILKAALTIYNAPTGCLNDTEVLEYLKTLITKEKWEKK